MYMHGFESKLENEHQNIKSYFWKNIVSQLHVYVKWYLSLIHLKKKKKWKISKLL